METPSAVPVTGLAPSPSPRKGLNDYDTTNEEWGLSLATSGDLYLATSGPRASAWASPGKPSGSSTHPTATSPSSTSKPDDLNRALTGMGNSEDPFDRWLVSWVLRSTASTSRPDSRHLEQVLDFRS